MNCKLLSVVVLCGAGLFLVSGQTAPAGVFTTAQAKAGRTAYDNACGKCHTSTLLGRKGDKGELPPLASLSAPYQKFIGARGFVPPLAGEAFLKKWGGNT